MPPDNLEELERAVKRTSRWVTALLTLFVLLVIGGCAYTYARVQKFLQPETVARVAVGRLEADYPQIRETVKQRLVKAAPRLAEKASKEVLKSMPQAREQLEDYLERQMDVGLEKAAELSTEQFRKFVRENHADIQKAFGELQPGPRETPRLADELDKLVEQKLGLNVRKEARVGLELLRKLNAKLEALRGPSPELTTTQRVERRIVRLLRTIEAREIGKLK